MISGTKGQRRCASMRDMRSQAASGADTASEARAGTPRVVLSTGRGVEITSREIRLIQLSRLYEPALGEQRIRVDDAVRYPLAPGIVVGSDIVDVDALSRAMSDCLTRHAARLAAWRPTAFDGGSDARGEQNPPIAVGLCPSVVTQRTVAMSELMPGFSMCLPTAFDEAAFAALEPWAMLFAQKISGIDPSDLAVDWFRPDPHDTRHLVVAAAQRHYLAVRHRVISDAGGGMASLCDAASAALGACRFVVARSLHIPVDGDGTGGVHDQTATGGTALYPAPVEGVRFGPSMEGDDACHDPDADPSASGPSRADESGRHQSSAAVRRVAEAERIYHDRRTASRACSEQLASQRFAALWIGERIWRAWTFDAAGASVACISLPEGGNAIDNLATLRAIVPDVLALALVAGEPEALEPAGGMRALREVLRCPAIEFDASSCCVGPACSPQQLGPAAAVAFGLALKELMR